MVRGNGSHARGRPEGVLATVEEFQWWWGERHRAGRFEVVQVPFAELGPWSFDDATGDLRHVSGRFFSVEGLRVETGGVPVCAQPVINQPEIGMLGILVEEFEGVLHCLMQAKMEPGNVNTLQLSPTVQATKSNYSRVHQGSKTRYLEHFAGPDRGEVLVDVIQSEQGSWYWRKRNRNIVVRAGGPVELVDDFRWLPLSLVYELLRVDNLVNMDARTVLSCMPLLDAGPDIDMLAASYHEGAGQERTQALHSLGEIMSWLIEAKTRCDWSTRLVGLRDVRGWHRTQYEIADDECRQFRIIGVRVAADNREVTTWTQPLLAPRGDGLAVFVARRIQGVPHLLVRAWPETGLPDMVELGPTIQIAPGADASTVEDPLLREVAAGTVGEARYDAVLSEEGGRFYHALTRYRVVHVDDEFPIEVPEDYRWMTKPQLTTLLRRGHYINIEARTLLACAHALW